MPQVSVIVPGRNVEPYIGALLGDLEQQTFTDIEVIIVDDGSTDRTPDIVGQVVERDRRFQQLDTGGKGVSAARNAGIDQATGEYLAFVDADDRISRRYVESLHGTISRTGSDLVSGNALRLEGYQTSQSILHRRACARAAERTHLSRSPQLIWDTTVWNKLWRREMWDRAGIRYAEGRWLNDFFPCIRGHVASRSVDVITDVVYYWRIRTDPTTSITDSRLTDPVARLKSFNDRMFAMRSARRMLAEELPVPAVLKSFDSRLLRSDLPIYLPYYPGADTEYQRAIVAHIGGMLEEFQIDPHRHPLDSLLRAVYRAIMDQDHARLERLLAPTTALRASRQRSQRTEAVIEGSEAPPSMATSHRLGLQKLRGAGRRLGAPVPVVPSIDCQARIDRIEYGPGTIVIAHGVVRVREGRSDVIDDWTASLELVTGPTRGRVDRLPAGMRHGARLLRRIARPERQLSGPPEPVAPQPDAALHPLVRSGWRPFTATIDLARLRDFPPRRWQLRVRLRAARLSLVATTRLTTEAGRHAPVLFDCGGIAAVTRPSRTGAIWLHCHPAPCRLAAAEAGTAGLRLSLDSGDGPAPTAIWWQSPGVDDPLPAVSVESTGVTIPLPPIGSRSGQYELWCQTGDTAHRVFADPRLDTVRVPGGAVDPGSELVVRCTSQGRVVLEQRPIQHEVALLAPGGPELAVVIGGTGRPGSYSPSARLVLRCEWTGTEVTAPLAYQPAGWQAVAPLAPLLPEDGVASRVWPVMLLDEDGQEQPLRVATGQRHLFPLQIEAGEYAVQLRVGDDHAPVLWVGKEPDGGRWRQLRKVQRSASGAGILSATAEATVAAAGRQPTADVATQPAPETAAPEPNSARLDTMMQRLTVPQRSRSRTRVGTPSFRYKMDERIRRRRYLLQHTDIIPVTQPLIRKLERDRIISELGFPAPAKLLDRGRVDEVLEVLEQRSEAVIKPVSGATGTGVYLFRRTPGGWLDLRLERELTTEAVRELLRQTTVRHKPVREWQVEELVVGDANTAGHPMDLKLYMFQGRHGSTTQLKRTPQGPAYKFYDPDWRPIDIGRDAERVDRSLPLPTDIEAVVELARQVSVALPTPFIRVDLLLGKNGLYIGEVTPIPGRFHRLADEFDQRLGLLWDIAEVELAMAFPADARFAPALHAIREVTGTDRIYPD